MTPTSLNNEPKTFSYKHSFSALKYSSHSILILHQCPLQGLVQLVSNFPVGCTVWERYKTNQKTSEKKLPIRTSNEKKQGCWFELWAKILLKEQYLYKTGVGNEPQKFSCKTKSFWFMNSWLHYLQDPERNRTSRISGGVPLVDVGIWKRHKGGPIKVIWLCGVSHCQCLCLLRRGWY